MRPGRFLAGLVALALALAVAWAGGLVWFAERVSHMAPEPGATDAIVVLTGGSERVAEGVSLLSTGIMSQSELAGQKVPSMAGVLASVVGPPRSYSPR